MFFLFQYCAYLKVIPETRRALNLISTFLLFIYLLGDDGVIRTQLFKKKIFNLFYCVFICLFLFVLALCKWLYYVRSFIAFRFICMRLLLFLVKYWMLPFCLYEWWPSDKSIICVFRILKPQAHGAWISFPPPPFLYYPPFFQNFHINHSFFKIFIIIRFFFIWQYQ